MNLKTLHIVNRETLANTLITLHISSSEDIITWQETLCVGPTIEKVASPKFLEIRAEFFKLFYNIELNKNEITNELLKLENSFKYSEIVLWFEYDLFCHINMAAIISLLSQKNIFLPISLVCSGRIEGQKDLKALDQLTLSQLQLLFDKRIALNLDDLALAENVWKIYCGNDHNLLLPIITRQSSFTYMSNCLKAHIKRFPDTRSGMSTLEYNILKLVKENTITSRHHLLGYTLHYQGYYGYKELQLKRIINILSLFFNENEVLITLNRKGHLALEQLHNYQIELDNKMCFGGIRSLDYMFDKKQNKLIKTIFNAY